MNTHNIPIEDFKLIKQFYPEFERARSTESNKFGIDWNGLMPVVQKIDALYSEAFPPGEEFIKRVLANDWPIDTHYTDVIAVPLGTPIKEVYESVIKFIKWYNENKSK